MSLVGLRITSSYSGMDSDDGDDRSGGNGTSGDGDIDDLGGDIVDVVLLVDLVDGRSQSQSGADGTQDDGGTHLDVRCGALGRSNVFLFTVLERVLGTRAGKESTCEWKIETVGDWQLCCT